MEKAKRLSLSAVFLVLITTQGCESVDEPISMEFYVLPQEECCGQNDMLIPVLYLEPRVDIEV